MILTIRTFNHKRGTGSVIRINLRPFARLRARRAAARSAARFFAHLDEVRDAYREKQAQAAQG